MAGPLGWQKFAHGKCGQKLISVWEMQMHLCTAQNFVGAAKLVLFKPRRKASIQRIGFLEATPRGRQVQAAGFKTKMKIISGGM
jgi:hypothetical protein